MEFELGGRAGGSEVLGVPLWSSGLAPLLELSLHAIDAHRAGNGHPFVFACANPHSLVVSDRDAEFKSALNAATAVVADGVGLTLVARRLYGNAMLPRITGSDYFDAVMTALDRRAGRVAFFGSRPEVLQLITARCATRYPRVHIVATISPPYGNWAPDADAAYLQQIREANPDVLWVGMTAPKQEKWVHANLERICAGMVGSIGAVFEYFAGTVKRAPQWVCRLGLEWAYRFAHEPARLWERNFISTPQFMGLALRERATILRDAARRRAHN
jgi:N-acetylglucosaminyldiphosphoundecaprenol N-acetyl-beta-D-mannosaminyltransferase